MYATDKSLFWSQNKLLSVRLHINWYRGENFPPPLEKIPPCYVPIWNKGGIFSQAEKSKFGIAQKQLILEAKTLSRGLKPKKKFACGAYCVR